MRFHFRSALRTVPPIEAAGLDAAHVQALVTARRRHRHRAATTLHDVLAQLQRQDRLAALQGLRVRERVLTKLMGDRQALVRSVAVRIAGYSGNRRWVPSLVALVDRDRDPFVRTHAVEALGNLRATEVLPLLARVAGDRAHPGCYHAVRALGQLLPTASPHLLSIAFGHEEPGLRRLAAETIARCAGPPVWTTFVAATAGACLAQVRATVVEGLGRSRAARAAAPVVRMLAGDPEPEVRVAAADALIAFGSPETVGALLDCARRDPFARPKAGAVPGTFEYPVREAAAEALIALGVSEVPNAP